MRILLFLLYFRIISTNSKENDTINLETVLNSEYKHFESKNENYSSQIIPNDTFKNDTTKIEDILKPQVPTLLNNVTTTPVDSNATTMSNETATNSDKSLEASNETPSAENLMTFIEYKEKIKTSKKEQDEQPKNPTLVSKDVPIILNNVDVPSSSNLTNTQGDTLSNNNASIAGSSDNNSSSTEDTNNSKQHIEAPPPTAPVEGDNKTEDGSAQPTVEDTPKVPIEDPLGPANTKNLMPHKNNIAGNDCGAKILQHGSTITHADFVLNSNKDEYMNMPCTSQEKWFVLETCEPVLIKTIQIANFERFSSNFKTFKLYASDRYPVKHWHNLGTFRAVDEKSFQTFQVENSNMVKYVKVELIDYYGVEHYCPLTFFRILGSIVIDDDDDDRPEEAAIQLQSDGQADDLVPSNLGHGSQSIDTNGPGGGTVTPQQGDQQSHNPGDNGGLGVNDVTSGDTKQSSSKIEAVDSKINGGGTGSTDNVASDSDHPTSHSAGQTHQSNDADHNGEKKPQLEYDGLLVKAKTIIVNMVNGMKRTQKAESPTPSANLSQSTQSLLESPCYLARLFIRDIQNPFDTIFLLKYFSLYSLTYNNQTSPYIFPENIPFPLQLRQMSHEIQYKLAPYPQYNLSRLYQSYLNISHYFPLSDSLTTPMNFSHLNVQLKCQLKLAFLAPQNIKSATIKIKVPPSSNVKPVSKKSGVDQQAQSDPVVGSNAWNLAFMRVKNQVRQLDSNVSVCMKYLDVFSHNYKQHTAGVYKSIVELQHNITQLTHQLNNLTQLVYTLNDSSAAYLAHTQQAQQQDLPHNHSIQHTHTYTQHHQHHPCQYSLLITVIIGCTFTNIILTCITIFCLAKYLKSRPSISNPSQLIEILESSRRSRSLDRESILIVKTTRGLPNSQLFTNCPSQSTLFISPNSTQVDPLQNPNFQSSNNPYTDNIFKYIDTETKFATPTKMDCVSQLTQSKEEAKKKYQ